jgi:hypothetical protein
LPRERLRPWVMGAGSAERPLPRYQLAAGRSGQGHGATLRDCAAPLRLQFDVLGNRQHGIDFYPEVADSALQLRVPDYQLDGADIACLLVDL